MDRQNMDDAKKVIEKLFPEEESRKAYLNMFAECIEEARRHGDEKWGVTLEKTKVRLNVVHNVVCTLEKGHMWFALPEKIDGQAISPNSLPGWETDSFKYKNLPSITGYLDYLEGYHDKTWPQIRKWFFKFIELAANKGEKLHSKSQKTHSPGVLECLNIQDRGVETSGEGDTTKPPEVEISTAIENPFESVIADIKILRKDPAHTERAHESLVESFYTILGYRKTSEIKYQIGRIDISIRVNEKTLIVNEVKKDWNLPNNIAAARDQAYGYAPKVGARFAVVTNGDYYAIYDRDQGYSYGDNFIGDFYLTALTKEKIKLIDILKK